MVIFDCLYFAIRLFFYSFFFTFLLFFSFLFNVGAKQAPASNYSGFQKSQACLILDHCLSCKYLLSCFCFLETKRAKLQWEERGLGYIPNEDHEANEMARGAFFM